jgi:hypothetical protein
MNLADDPRTLSISTGPTFRQKGEAFYSQLCRHRIPFWMIQGMQNVALAQYQNQILTGVVGSPFAALLGAVGGQGAAGYPPT